MIKKGQKLSEYHKKKMSESKMGDKNPAWKGNDVAYTSLHTWVGKYKPRPIVCEHCNLDKKLELANVGIYDKNFDNWLWLCRSCHRKFDGHKPIGLTFKGLKHSEKTILYLKENAKKRKRNELGHFV